MGEFPFTGFVAMVSAIGTLMVDAFATSYFRNSHNKSGDGSDDEDEEKGANGSITFVEDLASSNILRQSDMPSVFPQCKSPPHKKQLDSLFGDKWIDRSVAHILGYTQLNSRLRQTGSCSPVVKKKKTIVVDSTVSEESDSGSDSESDYDPATDMSRIGDGAVLSEMEAKKNKRLAMIEVRKAKLGKVGAGSKGKATVGSSSPCVTGDETVPIPVPRATAGRARVTRTPSFYDVDRCARWEAPSTVEGIAAGEQGLPVLSRPRKAHDFGVIGAPPQYAYDVLAPYMRFGGDAEKLKYESLEDGFGAMLENFAAQMARLSFYSRSVMESRREMDIRYQESQAEICRMQSVIDEGMTRQNQLVQDALAAYDRGAREGGLEGWSEAVKAYREAGHLDPFVVDSVPCYLDISDDGEDLMEGDGVGGSGVADAPRDGMLP